VPPAISDFSNARGGQNIFKLYWCGGDACRAGLVNSGGGTDK
jgi:hypothetical protein